MFPPLTPIFNRIDLAFERGEGAWLITTDGERYLDFGAGIAVSSLGHGHPHLVRAIAEQAGRVIHVSNLYRIPEAEKLAQRLVDASFADTAFFCNSGAEANEGMIKMIRRAQWGSGHPERTRFICFNGAFHGRTLATLSATGAEKYLQGFGPPVEGFDHVPFNNLNSLRDAITAETAGVIVETIQGEGGIRAADRDFLRGLRAACDEFGLYLAIDEVQTGVGRSGTLFSYQQAGVEPDVMTLAKGLGGGFPIGAVLAREAVAKHLTAGSHGTTFGGNPLACAAANAVLDVVLAPGFLEHVRVMAARFRAGLAGLIEDYPDIIADLRGEGLLIGLGLRVPQAAFAAALLAEHMLSVNAGENVVRLLPPLVATAEDYDAALACLGRALAAISR